MKIEELMNREIISFARIERFKLYWFIGKKK